jgi:hypothetical protein
MAIAESVEAHKKGIADLKRLISEQFPDARFKVTQTPDDDEGVVLWAYTSDVEQVRDLVGEREIELLMKGSGYVLTVSMPLEAWED